MKVEIMAINSEREQIIHKLEDMLEFFRHSPIKNEDSLIKFNSQLDDVMSSLKYVPSEPSFDCLPTEIKTDILSYLCDSGAFVAASVSQEWKEILEKSLKQLDQVSLAKQCSNRYSCKDIECFMPDEFLKAAITNNLDVPLSVCPPLEDIDTQLFVEGLTSVSNLSIRGIYEEYSEDLFEELEKKGKIFDSLELLDVDLTNLKQSKLVNYLLKKVKKLTLDETNNDEIVNGEMLDNELFIKTLLQISTDSQLEHLVLREFEYPSSEKYPNLSIDFADAICKVPSVDLMVLPLNREEETAKQLIKNIQTQDIRMKSFALSEFMDWRDVISPEELTKTLEKMDRLHLRGYFTAAQVKAAKSLGAKGNARWILKWPY